MPRPFSEQGLTEIAAGLRQAQGVLRRRRGNLETTRAGIEAELSELATIDSAIRMALEVLRAEAVTRERAARGGTS